MTSIFEGQSPKTRPFPSKTRGPIWGSRYMTLFVCCFFVLEIPSFFFFFSPWYFFWVANIVVSVLLRWSQSRSTSSAELPSTEPVSHGYRRSRPEVAVKKKVVGHLASLGNLGG